MQNGAILPEVAYLLAVRASTTLAQIFPFSEYAVRLEASLFFHRQDHYTVHQTRTQYSQSQITCDSNAHEGDCQNYHCLHDIEGASTEFWERQNPYQIPFRYLAIGATIKSPTILNAYMYGTLHVCWYLFFAGYSGFASVGAKWLWEAGRAIKAHPGLRGIS